VAVYLLLGLAGLPVFSAMQGGPGVLLGPTGGYLIGFLPMAALIGWLYPRAGTVWTRCAAMVCGAAALYAFGTVWLMLSTGLTLAAALGAAVLPFLAPEAVKLAAAVYIAPMVRRAMMR
jgi:biotin transport system substrate-specific component